MQTIISLKTPEFLSKELIFFMCLPTNIGLPRWLSDKESACQSRRHKRHELALGGEDHLEEEMATTSGILVRIILRTEEPGGLPSMGSKRDGTECAHMILII